MTIFNNKIIRTKRIPNAPVTSFFDMTKTLDLPNLSDAQIADIACCDTKKLAQELFNFCSENNDFPYNDPDITYRASNGNINEEDMRPYNEFAIKLMRRFGKLS